MAINQERVNAVCDELAGAGKKATLAAVREALGEGSFSTIGPMVQAWKTGRGEVAAGAANGAGAVMVPDAIQAVGGKLMAEVWALAEKVAGERLATERAAMEAARAEMAAELAQAYADMETLREELAKAKADAALMAEREGAAFVMMQNVETSMHDLRENLASAKAEAAAYKLVIDKFNPKVNQEESKKPAPGKKTGKPIAKTNQGPIDTKTAPLVL